MIDTEYSEQSFCGNSVYIVHMGIDYKKNYMARKIVCIIIA